MAKINKIDSNITGVRICEETSLGILPAAASQTWYPFEPNSYKDFGGQIKTVARNPINSSRQRKKGVVVDQDAGGGIVSDLTQTNLQRSLQGFFFADVREKPDTKPMNSAAIVITGVTSGPNTYTAAAGLTIFKVGHLLLASGFANAANNGLKRVTAVAAGAVTVNEATTVEGGGSGRLTAVGFQFNAGDATLTQTGGNLPIFGTTTQDLTVLGLTPGEFVFVGGDLAAEKYATAADNGFARIRSVATNAITFDKTAGTIVTDTGAAKTIRIFFGRLLKNELGTLVKRRTYTMERTLGYNDDTDITKQQAEYLPGSVANQLTFNVPTGDKVTAELSYQSLRDYTMDENVTGANTLLSKVAGASAPALVEADAFNTSSDVSRIKMSLVSSSVSCPTPLFAFVQEAKITIDNHASGNKAIGVVGSFEVSVGQFEVGGSLTAYFADVAAVNAVNNNSDITLDMQFVKANAGISIDMPLITLGNGRPDVQQDQAITLPLDQMAATGAKVSTNLDYTLSMVFYDYLPALADT
jgi:hypothetical protein